MKEIKQKTEVVLVSNAMALSWLLRNTSNRPVRRTVVSNFHQLYKRGEWKLTHQGIAFDVKGVLIDGQHRLIFISELPDGVLVPISVTTNVSEDTFGVIDVGARRTPSDELGISSQLSAAASFVAIIFNSNTRSTLTLPYLSKFVDFCKPYHDDLNDYCGTSAKLWSSAPVRTAAIIQMARGHNKEFVMSSYRSLVYADFSVMTPTAQALFRQQMSGKASSARGIDLFCRALRVFDSLAPSISKVQVASVTEVTKDVRTFLMTQIDAPVMTKNSPLRSGQNGAKPVANSIKFPVDRLSA